MVDEKDEDKLIDGANTGTEGEKDNEEVSADEGIESLKNRIAAQQEALAKAEASNRELRARAKGAEAEVQDSGLQLIKSAIETVKRDASLLKSQYADAMRNQNFDDAAEIQEKMSLNSARYLHLDNGRVALEEKLKDPQPAEPVRLPDDPVERLAVQLSPASGRWVRTHPQFATNPKLYRQMIRAHEDAVEDGYIADTREYFDFIEAKLGVKGRQVRNGADGDEDALSAAAAATKERSAPPAAPTSGVGSSYQSPKNSRRLTKDEQDIARMMGQTDEEYAANKAALKAEGRLN